MLQIDPTALAAILAHAARAAPEKACGLLVGRGGLGRREAMRAEPAAAVPVERARGRFDLHPNDWQRIDRAARVLGQDVVAVYCAHAGATLAIEKSDAATVSEGYSYLVVAPASPAPQLFAFEQTILGKEREPVEVAPVAPAAASRPPLMSPMPRPDDKNLGGHQMH
jgi:proteasome lid subunit RPN8/RPN11